MSGPGARSARAHQIARTFGRRLRRLRQPTGSHRQLQHAVEQQQGLVMGHMLLGLVRFQDGKAKQRCLRHEVSSAGLRRRQRRRRVARCGW